MIVTDGQGRPFERPEKPAPDADIETKIAYMRALAAYNDAISSYAGKEFAKAFKP